MFNVEGTAVAETERGYLFIWAERNSGEQHTEIKWTEMSLGPFALGPDVSSAAFQLPEDLADGDGNPLYSRPVVGIGVDDTGRIYTVAAFDPEGLVPVPDDDPFRSALFQIGQVFDETILLDPQPMLLGTVDGWKVESVAVRELEGEIELFVGTDDENYGGTLRRLPPPDFP